MSRTLPQSAVLALLFAGPILALSASVAAAQDYTLVGAGVATTPAYQGSKSNRTLPIPVLDIKRGRFFANLRNGVGLTAVDNETLTAGASMVFVPGYRRRDVPDGIDKLSSGAGVRLFTTMRAGGLVATVGGVKIVSGDAKGVIADASLSYPIEVSSRIRLTPTVGATWADHKYNDRYFGVGAGEAIASGLPQFTTGAGFKDLSTTLTASYRINDRLTLSATGGMTRLVGDRADSPLVKEKSQPLGILTLVWRM